MDYKTEVPSNFHRHIRFGALRVTILIAEARFKVSTIPTTIANFIGLLLRRGQDSNLQVQRTVVFKTTALPIMLPLLHRTFIIFSCRFPEFITAYSWSLSNTPNAERGRLELPRQISLTYRFSKPTPSPTWVPLQY